MSWVFLDDRFFTNRKVMSVSPHARWLYVSALCVASQQGTDGLLDESAQDCLMIAVGRHGSFTDLAAELVRAGLWTENGSGLFAIHDYLEYQPSAAEQRAQRAKNAARIKRHRQRNALPRQTTKAEAKPESGEAVTRYITHVETPSVTRVETDPRPDPTRPNKANANPPPRVRAKVGTTGAEGEPAGAARVLSEGPGTDAARIALKRFRDRSRDADGIPRLIIGPSPDAEPDMRSVEQFRSAIFRHQATQADLDAMAELMASGEEWGRGRGVAVTLLCQKAVREHQHDHFAELLGKARLPPRKKTTHQRRVEYEEPRRHPGHIPVEENEHFQAAQRKRVEVESMTPAERAELARKMAEDTEQIFGGGSDG